MSARRTRRPFGILLGALGAVVLSVLLIAGAVPAVAATPAPSASVAPNGGTGLSGHWAIAGTSGIDLVQKGSALTGSSAAGISLSGSVNGRMVTFRWWRGASYAKAKQADRGTGTMEVSLDGERLTIEAKGDDAGPGPFPTRLDAVRVHDILATASPKPWTWWYGLDTPAIYTLTRTYLDFIVESYVWSMETGYWPSATVIWIRLQDRYEQQGIVIVGGWSANGNGPILLIPPWKR